MTPSKRCHPLDEISLETRKKPNVALPMSPYGEHDLKTRFFSHLLEAARLAPDDKSLPLRSLLASKPTLDRQQQSDRQQESGQQLVRKLRGSGYTLAFRMAVVDICRFANQCNPKVTTYNFHKYCDVDVGRNSVAQWSADYEKIRYDVQHGRGAYCKLSGDDDDVVLHYVNKSVVQWLEKIRESGATVNGQPLCLTATKKMYHALIDSCSPDFRRPGRDPAFSVSWLSSLEDQCGVWHCKLVGQAGSVDKTNADFLSRMTELQRICGTYDLSDIYNCDEAGLYLTELSNHTDANTSEFTAGKKPKGGSRVSILFCINADGSSLRLSENLTALRPFVLSEHLPKNDRVFPNNLMTSVKNDSGYMNRSLFLTWLRTFDNQLSRPTLLILDSCFAYAKFEDGDPETGEPWKNIHIECLPVNSTAATQPLDQGVISVLKRKFLQMLSDVVISATYGTRKAITNGTAWSLIPYAWSHMKEPTLRHCFKVSGLLPPSLVKRQNDIDLFPPDAESSREPIPPPPPSSSSPKPLKLEQGIYVRFLGSVIADGEFDFERDTEQRDAEAIASAAVQALRSSNDATKAKGDNCQKRERSCSLEAEDMRAFDEITKGGKLAEYLKTLLGDDDPFMRKGARNFVRSFISEQNTAIPNL